VCTSIGEAAVAGAPNDPIGVAAAAGAPNDKPHPKTPTL